MSTHCNFKHGPREFVPLEGYYGAILFESVPPGYNRDIFAGRMYTADYAEERTPFCPYGKEHGTDNGIGGTHGKHFDGFMGGGGGDALKGIPLTQPCVEHWLWLTLFGEAGKRLTALDGLLEWSRLNAPTENPFLPALAMGLFTINGYAFDDRTGVYAMNERGKMLMDFIAEFPIPENATRVQAVMGGGNREEIEGMMKKHGTEAKWKELLKNPSHPAFAKYPQD
ncbi:MAG: hypothetical protein FWG50_12185 [Kiritimatiellaeota bacterium]|nr:hypothetical protein [Kiritimatiellota bacterium]